MKILKKLEIDNNFQLLLYLRIEYNYFIHLSSIFNVYQRSIFNNGSHSGIHGQSELHGQSGLHGQCGFHGPLKNSLRCTELNEFILLLCVLQFSNAWLPYCLKQKILITDCSCKFHQLKLLLFFRGKKMIPHFLFLSKSCLIGSFCAR